MPIMVECNSCGKQYSAEPAMAGRRVKCKQCGNVFQIPMSVADGGGADDESQDDLSALTALAELERSRSGEAYEPPRAGTGSRAGAGIRGGEGLAKSSMARTGEGKEDIPIATPEELGRPSVRFTFPFAKELDLYLPWTMVIGGLGVVALASLKMDPLLGQPNAPSAAWIPWVRLGVLVLMYIALVAPLSLRGIRMAGKTLRFQ